MIILDMDGTLLNSNRIVLESSKIILRKLKEQGKLIVVATGRCLGEAAKYLSTEIPALCNATLQQEMPSHKLNTFI